jgi:hypothetical protein
MNYIVFPHLLSNKRALIPRSTIIGSNYKGGKTRSMNVGSQTISGSKMGKVSKPPKDSSTKPLILSTYN